MATVRTAGFADTPARDGDSATVSPAQAMVDLLTSLATEHADRQRLIHDLTRSIERGNEQLRSAGLAPAG